jgi:hypothetical protein
MRRQPARASGRRENLRVPLAARERRAAKDRFHASATRAAKDDARRRIGRRVAKALVMHRDAKAPAARRAGLRVSGLRGVSKVSAASAPRGVPRANVVNGQRGVPRLNAHLDGPKANVVSAPRAFPAMKIRAARPLAAREDRQTTLAALEPRAPAVLPTPVREANDQHAASATTRTRAARAHPSAPALVPIAAHATNAARSSGLHAMTRRAVLLQPRAAPLQPRKSAARSSAASARLRDPSRAATEIARSVEHAKTVVREHPPGARSATGRRVITVIHARHAVATSRPWAPGPRSANVPHTATSPYAKRHQVYGRLVRSHPLRVLPNIVATTMMRPARCACRS